MAILLCESKKGLPRFGPFSAGALQISGKEYAGIGLGIDRLAMIMADVADIKEIELLVR